MIKHAEELPKMFCERVTNANCILEVSSFLSRSLVISTLSLVGTHMFKMVSLIQNHTKCEARSMICFFSVYLHTKWEQRSVIHSQIVYLYKNIMRADKWSLLYDNAGSHTASKNKAQLRHENYYTFRHTV